MKIQIGTLVATMALGIAGVAEAQQPGPETAIVRIGLLRAYEPVLALSALDIPPESIGIAGAELAIADNDTTGAFMGQDFELSVTCLLYTSPSPRD